LSVPQLAFEADARVGGIGLASTNVLGSARRPASSRVNQQHHEASRAATRVPSSLTRLALAPSSLAVRCQLGTADVVLRRRPGQQQAALRHHQTLRVLRSLLAALARLNQGSTNILDMAETGLGFCHVEFRWKRARW
jgi:hypothetical protein